MVKEKHANKRMDMSISRCFLYLYIYEDAKTHSKNTLTFIICKTLLKENLRCLGSVMLRELGLKFLFSIKFEGKKNRKGEAEIELVSLE